MLEAPHPSVPFAIGRSGTATTEQESATNIVGNIHNVAICPQGFRDDLPQFGLPDPTFETLPLDLATIEEALQRWEPAADLSLTEHRVAAEAAHPEVVVEVS